MPTWKDTQRDLGMPAAKNFQQSLVLAQLEILRRQDRQRYESARKVFHTVLDEEAGAISGEMLLAIGVMGAVVSLTGLLFIWLYSLLPLFGV